MTLQQGLQIEAESTGISKPLSKQVNLLGTLLGQVIQEQAGEETLNLVEKLRKLCKQAVIQNKPELRGEASEIVAGLDLDEIVWLLRSYTAFFHLVNQAEKQEIVRINRERARHKGETTYQPRPESIDEAVFQLKQAGFRFEEVESFLQQLDIQPTLTAHPTDARRRSTLYKQQHIAALLTQISRQDLTPEEQEEVFADLQNQIALLLNTDEVRAVRPTVLEEVEHGLYFLRNAIWETIPRIVHDVHKAVVRHYGRAPSLPVFLRFRSWIGSDRDGNPNVTASVTRHTYAMQRGAVLRRYWAELRDLRRELSISDRQVDVPQALYDSIADDAADLTLPDDRQRQYKHEPYRQKISYMMMRIEEEEATSPFSQRRGGYDSKKFINELQLLATCLMDTGFGDIVRSGRLGKLLVQAQAFGFHMASLDVRQHSRVHEEAVSTLLQLAGVVENYADLSEEGRLAILSTELDNRRPLLPRNASLPPTVQMVMDTFTVIKEITDREPTAIGSYIVSMTHSVSDLLEVMLLAKEAGLGSPHDRSGSFSLDIVPLFETVDDLQSAHKFLETLFVHPVYERQLENRGRLQEIMLGYSDSNKDGGFWMANWALHEAQDRIGQVCRKHNVDFRLFHGRGGTVGRGGGRASQAILAMPPVVHNGRIRFTEQGEVISFRYALPAIARRHLEQIVNAMIQAPASTRKDSQGSASQTEQDRALVARVADTAMKTYRGLVHDEQLWPWYARVTPIEQISRLPIASRPVSRKAANEVDFEGLRAIPWVFAWIQTRYMVPGWFGIGAGLHALLSESEAHEATLQRLYATWPFFRTILNNAQREMARARLEIAATYAEHGSADPGWASIHDSIARDFEQAREAILTTTGQQALLDNTPVIQKSIFLRNPYTDVLNLLQIELMKRYREAPSEDRARLAQIVFLSINGIAAAMQSTG